MPQIMVYDKLFVGGEWVEPAGSETIDVVSPVTEQVVARVPHATAPDVDRAVAAAREAFDNGPWPRMSLARRIEIVTRIKDALAARHRDLAELITLQNGSPVSFAVRGQALGVVAAFEVFLQAAARLQLEEERQGLTGPVLVRREPVGVVAGVIPWNAPQMAAAPKLAPALLAGCTFVLKPSPETPLDSYLLAEVCEKAGLPKGVLSVLPAGRGAGEYLVSHPGIDKVSFTGSVAAGKKVMAAAAQNLTRVALELGGKSAAIVLQDADLDAAVPAIIGGSCAANSGQACLALTRVLVPASRYDEVAAKLTSAFRALKVGDPSEPATVVGPMASHAQRQRVLEYIRIGQEEGAKVLAGGGVPDAPTTGWYVEPTLFGEVTNDMRIAREEIFGPVVCLIRYETEDEAVSLANDSAYGLSGAVFTADTDRGLRVARRIRTGTFSVNGFRVDLAAPFGGFKNSGLGREFGDEGLTGYFEYKSIALPHRSMS
ncbi:aldehyde dehydrogenase [Streptomyces pristinaespiralis]|uniref:aldehyde dehydrogenase (NAD(+)) n=2 Tax=Streptomyces pristinaespiralis TaxID=38300 RepID=B5H6U1_STRE2|nr:aldehyde dehydrogenase [Streptomyces pristinaespiralis]ALC18720.1 aldehyde dehydrogenase [Streptomyces pristinaespiralis]EDY62552.1 aldehyde dehydrogenase [Streptomyces pristinaespiralis ATCC 25486]QMU18117.1 aldehyde dehydrogenase [Streptomyces pristinaespiralis]